MHVDLGLIDWLYKKADGFAIFYIPKIQNPLLYSNVFDDYIIHTIFYVYSWIRSISVHFICRFNYLESR